MANKDLNIGIKVDSTQLDQTTKKLGELKQLSSKISIQYDIDGKPIDIVLNKSLNLQQQVKALTAELRRTKEGTAEFALLSTRLGDAQDQLAATTAKSKDLFSSLSLLPGPVGQFFSQLNGAIGLLKTFSSFSLKDLKFQLGETVNDIRDIKEGFTGANQSVNTATETTKESVNAFREQGDTIASVIDESKSLVDQIDLQSKAVKNISDLTTKGQLVNETYTTGLVKNAETGQLVAGVINKQTNATRVLTEAELQLVAAGKGVTLTTGGMIVAEEAATVATFTLAGAVKALGVALGIGGLILILTFVVDKLIELGQWLIKGGFAFDEAVKKTKEYTKALDDLDAAQDKSNKSLKRVTNERIALLKAQGASEEQIRKASINGLLQERDLTSKTLGQTIDVIKKLQANRGKNDEENNKQIERALKKKKELEETYKDQSSAIRVAELNNITENNKKIQENNRKAVEDGKKLKEQQIQDEKTAAQMLLDIKKENTLASIKNERDRQYKELELQAATEVDKVNALKINEEKKEELRNQIFLKFAKKQIDLKDKFNKEDEQKAKEFGDKQNEAFDKLNQYRINSIADSSLKEKEERQKKYTDEIKELDKLLKDKLINETQYNEALKNIKLSLENDLKKISDDAKQKSKEDRLKELDDELKFLQITNEANRMNFVAYWKGREELLQKAKQRELLEVEDNEKKKAAIEAKYAQLTKDLQREKYTAIIGYISTSLSQASNIISMAQRNSELAMQNELNSVKGNAQEQDKIKEKYFNKNKNTQIAQAIIQTLQSATGAFSAMAAIPIVGPALGAAAAAAALIFGYKQVDLIKKQQYQSSLTSNETTSQSSQSVPENLGRNYEQGGLIGGKRHAEGGTIIEAERGEAIMTRGAVTMFAPLLSMLNQMGGGTSFVKSAVTTTPDNPKLAEPALQQSPMIVKTYVVSNELSTEQQRQARLKDLSTL